jgi:hypothetical protein
MRKKGLMLFTLAFSLCCTASPAFAKTPYNWKTTVDIPYTYSPEISTGDHGIIIQGSQSLYSKKHSIQYKLVKNGIFFDEIYDVAEVQGGGKEGNVFSVKLKAPKGNGYQIKIAGYGKGNIVVTPY